MTISTWSYSRLIIFEQCKLRAKLQYVDKIPEPERPLPAGKTEHANERGTRIHGLAEDFVRSKTEKFPRELKKFEQEFYRLRELYKKDKVSLEGDWGLDHNWTPTGWMEKNTWGRVKLDAMVMLSKTHGVVIDYKTGKRYGNEIKHAEQGQLYQLTALLRNPELQTITVELWYTDLDELTSMTFTRAQGLRFFNNFNKRATDITSATSFPPQPNIFACKWCPYLPSKSGDCVHGVE